MQPYVSQLALYDIANVAGVAADLSHCNTAVQVRQNRKEFLRAIGCCDRTRLVWPPPRPRPAFCLSA